MSDLVATWRVESVWDGSVTHEVSDVVIVWRGECYQSRFNHVLTPTEKDHFIQRFTARRMKDRA